MFGVCAELGSVTFGSINTHEVLERISLKVDKILGQPNERETMLNRIVPNRGFYIGGVHIDTSTEPNRIYVLDTGNNRILGFEGYEGPKQHADIIIGQELPRARGAANRDNTKYMPAGAKTLAFQPYPHVINPQHNPRAGSMTTDEYGNLYVLDLCNNRILKYNDPFATDQVADEVWGQKNFIERSANRGQSAPAAETLSTSQGVSASGVDIDSEGNLWVTDSGNHRVLRFPKGSKTADLVLGQEDFEHKDVAVLFNKPLNKMRYPNSIKIDPNTGNVYVLEGKYPGDCRILVFESPFTNGMSAVKEIGRAKYQDTKPEKPYNAKEWESFNRDKDGIIDTWVNIITGLNRANGFTLDPLGAGEGIVVSDCNNHRIVLFDEEGSIKKIIKEYQAPNNSIKKFCKPSGEIGLDEEGNLYVATMGKLKGVVRFNPLEQEDTENDVIEPNGFMLKSTHWNSFSRKTFHNAYGFSVSDTQLFVSDGERILVWNRDNIETFGKADYVLGQENFGENFTKKGIFSNKILGAQVIDESNRLWVTTGRNIYIFQTPITQSDLNPTPIKVLTSNKNVYWKDDTDSAVEFNAKGIYYNDEHDTLWIIDQDLNRALHIKDPLGEAVVDLVIGQNGKNGQNPNGGLGEEDVRPWGLSSPSGITMDKLGNLYIIDASFKLKGNRRVIRFNNAEELVEEGNIFPLPKAGGVFTKPHLKTRNIEGARKNHLPASANWVTFNSENHMVLLADSFGNAQNERAYLYYTPHEGGNPQPGRLIEYPFGQAAYAQFDEDDNLIIQDHTWNRLLFSRLPYVKKPSSPPAAEPDLILEKIEISPEKRYIGTKVKFSIWVKNDENADAMDRETTLAVAINNSDSRTDGSGYVMWPKEITPREEYLLKVPKLGPGEMKEFTFEWVIDENIGMGKHCVAAYVDFKYPLTFSDYKDIFLNEWYFMRYYSNKGDIIEKDEENNKAIRYFFDHDDNRIPNVVLRSLEVYDKYGDESYYFDIGEKFKCSAEIFNRAGFVTNQDLLDDTEVRFSFTAYTPEPQEEDIISPVSIPISKEELWSHLNGHEIIKEIPTLLEIPDIGVEKYTIKVKAEFDPANKIFEGDDSENKDNNIMEKDIIVSQAPLPSDEPNFTIDRIDIEPVDEVSRTVGKPITCNVHVTYNGTKASPRIILIGAFFGKNELTGEIGKVGTLNPNIYTLPNYFEPGESKVLRFTWTPLILDVERYDSFGFVSYVDWDANHGFFTNLIDPYYIVDGIVDESDEHDNRKSKKIALKFPDISIYNGDLTAYDNPDYKGEGKHTFKIGDVIYCRAHVSNIGDGIVPEGITINNIIEVYTDDTVIHDLNISGFPKEIPYAIQPNDSLESNEKFTIDFSINTDVLEGAPDKLIIHFETLISPEEGVCEDLRELLSNNEVHLSLGLISREKDRCDFAIGEIEKIYNESTDTLDLTTVITNVGFGSANARIGKPIYVKYEIDGVYIGQTKYIDTLGVGDSFTSEFSLNVDDGTHTVRAEVDLPAPGRFSEVEEYENNWKETTFTVQKSPPKPNPNGKYPDIYVTDLKRSPGDDRIIVDNEITLTGTVKNRGNAKAGENYTVVSIWQKGIGTARRSFKFDLPKLYPEEYRDEYKKEFPVKLMYIPEQPGIYYFTVEVDKTDKVNERGVYDNRDAEDNFFELPKFEVIEEDRGLKITGMKCNDVFAPGVLTVNINEEVNVEIAVRNESDFRYVPRDPKDKVAISVSSLDTTYIDIDQEIEPWGRIFKNMKTPLRFSTAGDYVINAAHESSRKNMTIRVISQDTINHAPEIRRIKPFNNIAFHIFPRRHNYDCMTYQIKDIDGDTIHVSVEGLPFPVDTPAPFVATKIEDSNKNIYFRPGIEHVGKEYTGIITASDGKSIASETFKVRVSAPESPDIKIKEIIVQEPVYSWEPVDFEVVVENTSNTTIIEQEMLRVVIDSKGLLPFAGYEFEKIVDIEDLMPQEERRIPFRWEKGGLAGHGIFSEMVIGAYTSGNKNYNSTEFTVLPPPE